MKKSCSRWSWSFANTILKMFTHNFCLLLSCIIHHKIMFTSLSCFLFSKTYRRVMFLTFSNKNFHKEHLNYSSKYMFLLSVGFHLIYLYFLSFKKKNCHFISLLDLSFYDKCPQFSSKLDISVNRSNCMAEAFYSQKVLFRHWLNLPCSSGRNTDT